ncbi:MAG: hypothetical protein ACQERE_01590 [Pseudomonadota bacterium]
MPLFLAFAVTLLTLAGCSEEPAFSGGGKEFYEQPAWADYRERARDNGHEPGLSDWEHVPELTPEESLEACDEARGAVENWAESRDLVGADRSERLQIDMRTRQEADGSVTGLLQRWGFRDDAVAGVDHRLRLTESAGCWEVERVEARHYCRRGLEDGRCR